MKDLRTESRVSRGMTDRADQLINYREIEGIMTTETTETEKYRTATEIGLDGPGVNWARRTIRTNRSPMNPTIVQGNRYDAIRRKWADCRSSGSARQAQ